MFPLILVDLLLDRAEGHICNLLDPAPYLLYFLLRHVLLQIAKG